MTNIPGPSNVTKGSVVAPYTSPAPPEGTHRYIVLVYEQPTAVKAAAISQMQQRVKFDIAGFAATNKLGAPAGATLFTATAGQ